MSKMKSVVWWSIPPTLISLGIIGLIVMFGPSYNEAVEQTVLPVYQDTVEIYNEAVANYKGEEGEPTPAQIVSNPMFETLMEDTEITDREVSVLQDAFFGIESDDSEEKYGRAIRRNALGVASGYLLAEREMTDIVRDDLIDLLIQGSRDEDWNLRISAMECMEEAGLFIGTDTPYIDILLERTDDENSIVQQRASEIIDRN